MPDYYTNDDEIAAVIDGFENCTTSKEEFTHSSHLTVATYYLRDSSPDEAFHKMSFGLLKFLDHCDVGRRKYNEKLTRKWITLITNVIAQTKPDASRFEVTNVVLARLGELQIAVAHNDENV
ncbi:MAG: hypothetical protein ABJC10_09865 [Acidobacteriota bacterium]